MAELNQLNVLRAKRSMPMERERWWPPGLGTPATFGSSEGLRYASFPLLRRLVIDQNGTITTYDTSNYQFRGVLQRRGADGKMSFLSQYGRVELLDLAVVG
jgi:hypothetical protein